MLDAVGPAEYDVARRFAAIHVHSHRHPSRVCLGDRRADLLHRVVVRAVIRHQLDGVRAVINVSPHRFADFVRGVRIDVLKLPEWPQLRGNAAGLPSKCGNDFPRIQNRRAGEPSHLDRATQIGVGVIGGVADIFDRREAGFEYRPRVANPP